jgi:hypothetical protein
MVSSKGTGASSAKLDYWQGHVSEWSVSGLSQAEYCRRHGLSAHCLRLLDQEA